MDVGGILVYDRDSFTRRKEHGRRRRTRLVCSEMDMHSDRNMQRAGDLDHIGQELFACELYVPLLAETDQLVAPFWKHSKLGPDAFEMMYHIEVRTQSLLYIEFMVPNAKIQLLVVLHKDVLRLELSTDFIAQPRTPERMDVRVLPSKDSRGYDGNALA
jgi:hypothetical protein